MKTFSRGDAKMQVFSNYPAGNIRTMQMNQYSSRIAAAVERSQGSTRNVDTVEIAGTDQLIEPFETYSVQSVRTNYMMATKQVSSNEIFNEWMKELGGLVDQQLTAMIDQMKEKQNSSELTDEFVLQLLDEQLTWILERRDDLIHRLQTYSTGSEREWEFYQRRATEILNEIDNDMVDAILGYYVGNLEPNISFAEVIDTYFQSEKMISEEIETYIINFEKELLKQYRKITGEQRQQYLNDFSKWKEDLVKKIEETFNKPNVPQHTKDLFLETFTNNLQIMSIDIWMELDDAINKRNQKFENEEKLKQANEIAQFKQLQVQMQEGNNNDIRTIKITTSKPSLFDYSVKLVVEGSYGQKKDLYICFKDERMKKEFEKRLKQAGLDGKKISSKKLEEIMKDLKKAIKDFSNIDLESVKRRLEKGEQNKEFESSFNRFISLLKRAMT